MTALHALIPLAIVAGWALVIRDLPLRHMTDLGLVSILPPATFVDLFLLSVSFALVFVRRRLDPVVALLHVTVLIVMLYGITSFVESVPRFTPVWRFAGIMDYIGVHGSVNVNIDAFFDWPSFLSFGTMLTEAAGFHSPLAFAGWGPLLFNLLFLPPLLVIFRWATDDRRVTWLGLWVFYCTNWILQDYISNQAMGFTLWLAMLAALLTWFTPRPREFASPVKLRRLLALMNPRGVWRRAGLGGDESLAIASPRQRALILLLVVLVYCAIVTGHQLTPVPAIITVGGLVLFAGLETRLLLVLMIVLLVAWLGYMTTSFLAGEFRPVVNSLGKFSQNLNQSVGARQTGSPGHELILVIREYSQLGLWLIAAVGFVRRLRNGHADIALMVTALAALLLPLLQSYGGEVVFRVILFALPAASFFIAGLVFPSMRVPSSWATALGIVVLSCAMLAVFQYTRYGNEKVDYFTKGDVATVQAFYRLAKPASVVYAGNGNLPWLYRDYVGYTYRYVSSLREWNSTRPNARALALHLRSDLVKARGGYVIVTRSTKVEAQVYENKPQALDDMVTTFRRLPGVQELYHNQDGDLLYVSPSAARALASARG